jgi:hypothetical protein
VELRRHYPLVSLRAEEWVEACPERPVGGAIIES